MDYLSALIIVAVVVIAAAWWIRWSLLRRLAQPQDDQALSLLQNQMNATTQQTMQQMDQMRETLQKMTSQINQTLGETNKAVDDRLDSAAKVIHGVSKQLGQLEESTRHIFDIGKSISGLESILQAPKLRGNLSELFLDDLLSQILPPHHYETQYVFKGGEIVDAVINLRAGMVPVDAKFPLENFRKMAQAEDEEGRKAGKKTFLRDVKKHIDAIASKYIRTDEGTFDFALMYIPAENIYYETIIKEDESTGDLILFNYALNKRVIPVSPNSFYAYLQTILLGLKGMRVEESARDIINNVARLRKEFEKFSEAFRLVGTHLDRSHSQYTDAEKRLGKIENKMEQIEGVAGPLGPGDAPMLKTPES